MRPDVEGVIALVWALVLLGGVVSAVGARTVGVVVGLWRKPHPVASAAWRRTPGHETADPAWPTYTAAQLSADLRRQSEVAWQAFRGQRRRVARVTNRGAGVLIWIFLLPVPVLLLLSWLAGAIGMLLLSIVCFLAFAIVLVAGRLLHVALVVVGRLADAAWIRAHAGRASCPHCYALLRRPAVACDRCGQLHRDIRAGEQGAIVRRCDCGRLLPTTVSRAVWSLPTACPVCESPLHAGAGALRDVRIAVLGDTGSGTTRLVFSAFDRLRADAATSGGRPVRLADPATEAASRAVLEAVRTGTPVATTRADPPDAWTVREGTAVAGALIHCFDPAGALLRDADAHDALGFLADAQGLVHVVDPFAISAVRREVEQRHGPFARLAGHDDQWNPEDLYGAIVSRMRTAGVRTKRQRLAIVLSKADLLQNLGLAVPTTSAEVQRWLEDRGQHNLVIAARREFRAVRYFASGRVPAAGPVREPTDPAQALRWLAAPQRAPLRVSAGGGRASAGATGASA